MAPDRSRDGSIKPCEATASVRFQCLAAAAPLLLEVVMSSPDEYRINSTRPTCAVPQFLLCRPEASADPDRNRRLFMGYLSLGTHGSFVRQLLAALLSSEVERKRHGGACVQSRRGVIMIMVFATQLEHKLSGLR